jgi:hypothetical protein
MSTQLVTVEKKIIPSVVTASPNDSLRDGDPFLRPEWRFERTLEMVDVNPPGRILRHDDDYIKMARSYMLRWRKATPVMREKIKRENIGLWKAFEIHEKAQTDPEVAFIVQAMTLANFPLEEIADYAMTWPTAIEWYGALFFDAAPKLRHEGWVLKHILLPAADRFTPAMDDDDGVGFTGRFITPPVVKPHLDMTLKFFSYFGGPILCQFMLAGFKRGVTCHTQDEIGAWLNEQWMVSVQSRSTQAAGVFEINKYNVMELFATHARIMEVQMTVEDGGERRTLIERHIHAMLTEIPWTVGSEAKAIYAGTDIGRYDEMAAELRDEELLLVAAGDHVPNLEKLPGMVMPLGPDKEVKHGNPQ